ncbi:MULTISPECIES: hypothetical protein [unclassified Amycolatopsis]|uniref:hypothetical protein n=1 Tax=unclassified Amycolatopsis TaxID=2618356 RepID=UPI002876E666|nr:MULTISPECIES: hypothetical protein [unclassified Amycolatopsis]MDS0135707.1 hypothetical protein [Amycolatopsis sp. 505]MDS0148277.1 hypothetical protein [Amycolatopsis sp. CM201R]
MGELLEDEAEPVERLLGAQAKAVEVWPDLRGVRRRPRVFRRAAGRHGGIGGFFEQLLDLGPAAADS